MVVAEREIGVEELEIQVGGEEERRDRVVDVTETRWAVNLNGEAGEGRAGEDEFKVENQAGSGAAA